MSAIVFLLRTFGALELTTEQGEPVAGAAGQRKPLLILALAALVPGGIPRDRLLRALWPDVDRARARATLKQHLYALRRATGDAALVAGAPRLRGNPETVRVDAQELLHLIDEGRLHEAASFLNGELLEDVDDPAAELQALISEIRAHYAPAVAVVRQATAIRTQVGVSLHSTASTVAPISAERELAAAARRFARGVVSLPADLTAAQHRVAWSAHDLLEALRAAEVAAVRPERIGELLAEADHLWRRSQLVREMIATVPGQSGAIESLEWLVSGGVRTSEPIGRALERFVLDSGIASLLRTRASWEMRQLAQLLSRSSATPPRILALSSPGSRDLVDVVPLLRRTSATVVLADPDDRALALSRHRLTPLGDRLTVVESDPFAGIECLRRAGPFDLILTGVLFDQLEARPGSWLIEQLISMLAADGRLTLSSHAPDAPFGPWLRHVADWPMIERDQDDILRLVGNSAASSSITWEHDPTGHAWLVTVRSGRQRSVTERAA